MYSDSTRGPTQFLMSLEDDIRLVYGYILVRVTLHVTEVYCSWQEEAQQLLPHAGVTALLYK